MDKRTTAKISCQLSFLLMLRPDSIGLKLAEGGWINVDDLLAALASHGQTISKTVFQQVIAENDKQRFEFSDDGLRIRARQSHSVQVDLGYQRSVPPDVLYHGTATRFLASILDEGLLKGSRLHVHSSTNKEAMLQGATQHGKPVLLAIDAKQMLEDGHIFYLTGNNVWLTDRVPPKYLSLIDG